MLKIPGKIPVVIHPSFFFIAALIGYFNSQTVIGTLIWIAIIFLSVLVHEYGHALTAKCFGLDPRIELVAMGGLTYHEGGKLPYWKQFLVVFNGPLFGFLLFVIAHLLLKIPALATSPVSGVLYTVRFVNLFWTILNLLPVLPLDGGQLLRIVLERLFGVHGFRYALGAGMVIATILSLTAFLYQSFLMGALLFLFAFSAFDAFRKSKHISEPDRSEDLKRLLEQAEQALSDGQTHKAEGLLAQILVQAKRGMLHTLATQYLGMIKYEKGDRKDAYLLLRSIQIELTPQAQCILHRLAFEEKDYALVHQLSGTCYQIAPSPEAALQNAYASAHLSQVHAAVGWLHTAFQEGVDNLSEITKEEVFDSIRHDPLFQDFLKNLKP